MPESVKVTAVMLSPLVGDPPMLDSLLELRQAKYAEAIAKSDRIGRHRGYLEWREAHFGKQLQDADTKYCLPARNIPPPPMGCLPIPINQAWMSDFLVAQCSSPIMPRHKNLMEHMHKRIDTGEIGHILGGRRMSIHHGTGETKSYRKPVVLHSVDRIVWFAVVYGGVTSRNEDGSVKSRRPGRAEIKRHLKRITAIGAKRTAGYGQVAQWEVEKIDRDYSLYADSDDGPILMRPIPLESVRDNAIGWRAGMGACSPPYWHPERRTKLAVPW